MADNLFYNDAREMVLKFIMKEFATMPEPLITNLINYFYKFCSYEEEGLKIRPSIIFCNDINQIIKNIPLSFKLQLFADDDSSMFNSRMKSIMSFCKKDWNVYVEIKEEKIVYGICKVFNTMKDKGLVSLVLENQELLDNTDKFNFINLEAISSYAISMKGIRGNEVVINFSINDVNVSNREGVVKRFVNASLSKLKTTKRKLAEVKTLYENIFKKAFNDIHGAICVIVDKEYVDKGFFADGIWLETPIDLSKVFLQSKSYSESKLTNISELFISMLNCDGITIVDNVGRIRAYNVFISTDKSGKKNIAGGARKRAAYAVVNTKLRRIIGVYFQSQDGEIFYEEVQKKWVHYGVRELGRKT